jgi:energy-coupling factor transporter ATP-binding protein EcfA2
MLCVLLGGGIAAGVSLGVLELKMPELAGAIGGGAVVLGVLLRLLLGFLARRQVRDRGTGAGVFLAEADRSRRMLEQYADDTHAARRQQLADEHKAARKKADGSFKPRVAALVKQGIAVIEKMAADHVAATADRTAARTAEETATAADFDGREQALAVKFDGELAAAETAFATTNESATRVRAVDWNNIKTIWFGGLERLAYQFDELSAFAARHFPDWSALRDGSAPLATTVPAGIRFGEYRVRQADLPDGVSADPQFIHGEPLDIRLPAYLPFPEKSAVLLKARDDGRTATVALTQAMMLRFLVGLPPGKVRFTIIDPVGLGENFGAFMHLADSDEQLVSSRIWTEPPQIEQKLTDLTEHMETVIQKYLRNQYKSIEEYNRAAGEVAEPYRVLVIANFPTSFTPDAARRLVSIMSSGPACGVCTLVGVDAAMGMPRDFRLADLEAVALNLHWKDGHFTPTDPALTPFPLTVDAPPSSADIADIAKRAGEASLTAARVEVPFEFIAPAPEKVWSGSTRDGFVIPIGRAGATRRQMLTLGKGTAQHALIAGKTGSGKSTLLHALITNLALNYSPDEAELYLIDFKKGVEFKMYAATRLPHARVVAIESEREFGLSVLSRLDGILRERGDRFRDLGVNDVAGFRDARPDEKLPRILLVVDEFQEFFTEDDKLAQEAGLLLDRLVRQGRAFGVHVLLGSQTLGGAYSLARSTIDQMAVRIALQCSEADAQLILNKDNTAARLLTRPGEAIYNDANGLAEGNDPFQVVWLSEEKREAYLRQLHARSGDRPMLVFEGSSAGDVTANVTLNRLADAPADQLAAFGPPTIWLGDAIAIKDPTAAVFRPQSGSNLLLLGQHEEAARGIFATALAALLARLRPDPDARVLSLIDGTPDDADEAEALRTACKTVNSPGILVERVDVAAAVAALAGEVEARLRGESADRGPRFLFVFGLHRLRELRKPDEDFGFGRRGEKTVTPGEQFAAILRDGPPVGIHVVVWCDSVTNLGRALDRQAMKEFTLRVLFQMSATDSSQLIDTPAASKLGRTRALFIEEGLERPEKFRPYGMPGWDWLRHVGDRAVPPVKTGSTSEPSAGEPMPVRSTT